MATTLLASAQHLKMDRGDRRYLQERVSAILILSLLSIPAHAADPISNLLNKAVDFMTNQWAVASAVVTIAAIGYRMKYGMMDKRKALTSVVGIVVVFGAALIVDQIRT